MGVEHPDVNKRLFISPTPQTVGSDSKPCAILLVCTSSIQCLPREWLQFGFNADLIANLCREVGCQVSDLIVPNGG